ncbi:MAG: protease modulator HflK, partial [Candidatus Nucleicultricaceae bacterium]
MPWQDKGGGPWWRPGGPKRDPEKAFEELKKKSQEKLKGLIPGGQGGSFFVGIVIFFLLALWVSRGIYFVQEGEQACEILFGRYVNTTSPGPHLWWPSPIGDVIVKKVSHVNRVDSGVKMKSNATMVGDNAESLMLTGDEN